MKHYLVSVDSRYMLFKQEVVPIGNTLFLSDSLICEATLQNCWVNCLKLKILNLLRKKLA